MGTKDTLDRHSRAGGSPAGKETILYVGSPGHTLKGTGPRGWRKSPFGFTLVELIVVITILVILGTIAFLNLGNFSGSARDSARVSDLTNISKGLDLFYIKDGKIPNPEAGTNAGVINILSSWSVIGYQWAIGYAILSTIKMGWDGKDPLDKKSYTYVVNSNKTKYQLLGLMEDSGNIAFDPSWVITDRAYAGYETRYPTSKGSALGVLLGNSGTTVNQPIQENYSTSFTGVEIFTSTGGLYKAVLSSKSSLSGTWPVLWEVAGRLDTSIGAYPGCDTPNIKLANGQIWAACNVGASHAYAGEPITNCNGSATDCDANLRYTLGSYFQWGRNDDVTAQGTPTATLAPTGTLSNNVGHTNFIYNATSSWDWITTANDNLWGWQWTTSTGGTWISQGSPSAMQWPCATGYHVPTYFEWWQAISSLSTSAWDSPAITVTNSWQNNTSVSKTLKFPRAGYRDNQTTTGYYYSQKVYSIYWSSSPNNTTTLVHCIIASGNQINPLTNYGSCARGLGLSVRCIKN